MEKEFKCCLCGKTEFGWGNNPWPVDMNESARCCDNCNTEKVIPARLISMMMNTSRKNK